MKHLWIVLVALAVFIITPTGEELLLIPLLSVLKKRGKRDAKVPRNGA